MGVVRGHCVQGSRFHLGGVPVRPWELDWFARMRSVRRRWLDGVFHRDLLNWVSADWWVLAIAPLAGIVAHLRMVMSLRWSVMDCRMSSCMGVDVRVGGLGWRGGARVYVWTTHGSSCCMGSMSSFWFWGRCACGPMVATAYAADRSASEFPIEAGSLAPVCALTCWMVVVAPYSSRHWMASIMALMYGRLGVRKLSPRPGEGWDRAVLTASREALLSV